MTIDDIQTLETEADQNLTSAGEKAPDSTPNAHSEQQTSSDTLQDADKSHDTSDEKTSENQPGIEQESEPEPLKTESHPETVVEPENKGENREVNSASHAVPINPPEPVESKGLDSPGPKADVSEQSVETQALEGLAGTISHQDAQGSVETPATETHEPNLPEAKSEPKVDKSPVAAKPEASPPIRTATVTVEDDTALFDDYMSAMDKEASEGDGSYKKLSRGERIYARIVQVENDRVFVDLGTKSEGVVPLSELSHEAMESAKDHFKVGDQIHVVVIRTESSEGNAIASKKRAEFEENWDRIEEALNSGAMITATVIERVKGGLVVDVGVRGFVPATHVGSGKLRNIEKFLGQEMQLKVIDVDRDRKKVVLSNREAENMRKASAKDDLFEGTKVDDVLEGSIRRLTDYGAFVDLGGVDGLLHISEMSWSRITHPKEMFKEGQKIKVQVLKLDKETGKISLGHRQVLPDPWKLIKDNYAINQKITVTISRLASTGAFIKLPEGAEAFMPMSEMSNRRIRTPQEAVEEGAEVEARIIDLKADQRRMVLSLRDQATTDRDVYRPQTSQPNDDRGGSRGGAKTGKKTRKPMRGGRESPEEFDDSNGRRNNNFSSGGATIGERLGALRGFFRRVEEEDPAEEPGSEAPSESESIKDRGSEKTEE